jgi:hypothetical protein
VSFGPKGIIGTPRSDIPENHFGWWGGYVKALDCNEGDSLSVCMGMQLEVGTLVPYDHQWQIVQHPNGNKAGQISLFLGQVFHIRGKRSKDDRVPFTFSDGLYVLAGLGYSFGNAQARAEETPTLEVGTAF